MRHVFVARAAMNILRSSTRILAVNAERMSVAAFTMRDEYQEEVPYAKLYETCTSTGQRARSGPRRRGHRRARSQPAHRGIVDPAPPSFGRTASGCGGAWLAPAARAAAPEPRRIRRAPWRGSKRRRAGHGISP